MAETKIEWTATYLDDGTVIPGYTFNPWVGCTRMSSGCLHCYAETLMDSRYGKVDWGPQGERLRTSEAYWRKPRQWNKRAQEQGIRMKVFCGSLCDIFEEKKDQPSLNEWRAHLWQIMENTPNLDWLLLTKRPEHVRVMAPAWWGGGWPENVWLGTSVEDQATADKRIPHLLQVPARIRFLSCEPLLGPIDLRHIQVDQEVEIDALTGDHGVVRPLQGRSTAKVHWVIAGGESGHEARAMHPDWARSLCNDCQAAGVPYFMKQLGSELARELKCHDKKGGDWNELPHDLRFRDFPES